MALPHIFSHRDPVAYLNEAFLEKRRRNRQFSLRAWARQLGLTEATPLSQILKGKRSIPHHYANRLAMSLELGAAEAEYLEALIAIRAARSERDRTLWNRRAESIRSKVDFQIDYLEDFTPYENPLTMILLALSETRDFRFDPAWIRKRLAFDATEAEITNAFRWLVRDGVLIREANGNLTRNKRYLFSRPDIPSESVRKFHATSLEQAAASIHRLAPEAREYASYVLAIDPTELPEAKRAIRAFAKRFIGRFAAAPATGEAVFHLNLNFFPQTRDVRS